MGRLFLPGLVVSAENQGTFSDTHCPTYEISDELPIVIVGDDSSPLSESGIFCVQALHHNWGFGLNVSIALGSRLSKN